MGTDVKIASTTFAAPTSTGEVDVTIPDLGWTPKAAMFFAQEQTTEGSPVGGFTPSVGWTDGTRQLCATCFFEDNATATGAKNRNSDISCIAKIDGSTVRSEGVFTAFIADGVTLDFTTALDGDYLIGVVFFGGADLQAHANVATATDSTDVTAPGFRPSVVFATFGGGGTSFGETVGNTCWLSYGFAADDASDPPPQRLVCWGMAHNQDPPGLQAQYVSSDEIASMVNISGGTVNRAFRVDTFDASGFTFTRTIGANTTAIGYLALDLSDFDAQLIEAAMPSPAQPQAVSGFGFAPNHVFTLGSAHATLDTVTTTDDGRTHTGTWGYFNPDEAFSVGSANQALADPTNANSNFQTTNDVEVPGNNGSVLGRATVTTFDVDGFTLNWSQASALVPKMFYLGTNVPVSEPVATGTGIPVQSIIG